MQTILSKFVSEGANSIQFLGRTGTGGAPRPAAARANVKDPSNRFAPGGA